MKKSLTSICCFVFTIFYITNAVAQCPNLPTAFPPNQVELENANRIIAECFSPTIHALASDNSPNAASGRADLIVSPFFDGGQ